MKSLKRLYVFLVATLLLPFAAAHAGDGKIRHMTEKVPNSYIVVLEKGQDANAIAPELERIHGGHVAAVMDRLGMFSITVGNETAAENIARDPRVAFVQEDAFLHPASCRQLDPSGSQWGLAHLNDMTQATHFGAIVGSMISWVQVYVIDSAINSYAAADFTSNGMLKVRVGANFAPTECGSGIPQPGPGPQAPGGNGYDHGGEVASVIAGNIHGVVPEVPIITSVIAMSDTECVNDTSLASAANYVVNDHQRYVQLYGTAMPAVANVSIVTIASDPAFDAAIASMVSAGVFVSAAAGNGVTNVGPGVDACTFSPAELHGQYGYPGLMIVGATNIYGGKEGYSNYGTCVDLWASGGDATNPIATVDGVDKGTSFAAPLAAGAAAVYLSQRPTSPPANVWYALKQASINYYGTQILHVGDGCQDITVCAFSASGCFPLGGASQ